MCTSGGVGALCKACCLVSWKNKMHQTLMVAEPPNMIQDLCCFLMCWGCHITSVQLTAENKIF